MTRATESNGRLAILKHCKIFTPKGIICLRVLPELTDSKSAAYANETVIGRTTPVVTYSHSEPRMINSELTFIITKCEDIGDNLRYLRIIQSLVYPGDESANAPYTPPPVSRFVCGQLFARQKDICDNDDTAEDGVCVILKSYNVRYPTEVAWDTNETVAFLPPSPQTDDGTPPASYLPYRFTVSCSWEVVYACAKLPTCAKIAQQSKSWCPIPKGLEP